MTDDVKTLSAWQTMDEQLFTKKADADCHQIALNFRSRYDKLGAPSLRTSCGTMIKSHELLDWAAKNQTLTALLNEYSKSFITPDAEEEKP